MTETSRFDYYIAAPTSQPVPEGMEAFTVPAATWAVFTCVGPMPGAIQEMQKRIATEWLPTSGYEFGNAPDIEAYFDEDGPKPVSYTHLDVYKRQHPPHGQAPFSLIITGFSAGCNLKQFGKKLAFPPAKCYDKRVTRPV